MDKRPHAPDCFCYTCEAEQFSAARAAKDKADERLARTAFSDLIEVRMRGGTIIRIPAARGDGMPYDLLLEALKVCQHWDDDEDEWRDGDPFVYLEVIHG